MDRRGPQVRAADVTALEQHCGFQLPEDYRAFLLEVAIDRPRGPGLMVRLAVALRGPPDSVADTARADL